MFKEFISFDKMITPSIIKILFWIGLIMAVVIGLVSIGSGITSVYGGGAQVFMGIIIIILGPLTVRVYCELLIIIFKIHENLVEINKNGKEQEKIEIK